MRWRLPRDDLERLVREPGRVAPRASPIRRGSRSPAARRLRSLRARGAARGAARAVARPTADAATESRRRRCSGGTDIRPDLRARYDRVRATAASCATGSRTPLADTTPAGEIGTADAATLGRLVRGRTAVGHRARRSVASPPGAGPRHSTDRPTRWSGCDTGTRVARHPSRRGRAAQRGRPPDDLVSALAALVSPTGQLAVLSRLRRADLPSLARSGAAGAVDLDRTGWRSSPRSANRSPRSTPTCSPQSPPGGAGAPLSPWTNARPTLAAGRRPTCRRIVVAYAAPALDLRRRCRLRHRWRVACVDRFGEVIPDEEQSTGVAFGFDAPAARAPQAILLAVPPDLDAAAWTTQTLVAIVAETRALARARMARPADLRTELGGLLPDRAAPGDRARPPTSLDPTGMTEARACALIFDAVRRLEAEPALADLARGFRGRGRRPGLAARPSVAARRAPRRGRLVAGARRLSRPPDPHRPAGRATSRRTRAPPRPRRSSSPSPVTSGRPDAASRAGRLVAAAAAAAGPPLADDPALRARRTPGAV